MMDLYPLVYVEWRDAEHDGSWSDIRDERAHVITVCVSSGWLIHRDKHRIILCGSVNPIAYQVGNKQYIPIKMITKYRVIKRGKSKR